MSQILELDITLKGCKPKTWRRLLVDAGMNFHELHYAIQFAMGWTNSHLHQFIVGRGDRYIGIPNEDIDMMDMEDGRKMAISELLRVPKDNLVYEYDFGDSWEHLIEVKKVYEPAPGKTYPVLIDGKGACPPEDCGGIWGYAELLEKLKKPGTEEYEEMVEWLGDDFDPEEFDLAGINDRHFRNFKKEVKEWDKLAGW